MQNRPSPLDTGEIDLMEEVNGIVPGEEGEYDWLDDLLAPDWAMTTPIQEYLDATRDWDI
jgi:hypothetical protein